MTRVQGRPEVVRPKSETVAPKAAPVPATVDFEPKAPDGDAFEPAAQTRGPVALDQVAPAKIDPHDWHLPSLGEVFGLAKAYPGKRIFLDSKTAGRPEVATRLAQQYVDLLRQYPYMRDRVIVANPDPAWTNRKSA